MSIETHSFQHINVTLANHSQLVKTQLRKIRCKVTSRHGPTSPDIRNPRYVGVNYVANCRQMTRKMAITDTIYMESSLLPENGSLKLVDGCYPLPEEPGLSSWH